MALKFEQALSPVALRQLYQMLNQMRSTGRVVTPKDMEAAYRSVLNAEVDKSLQNRQLAMNRDQWQRQMKFQREMYEDKKDADSMAGMGMLGSLGLQALRPNSSGQTPIGQALGYLRKPLSGISDLFASNPAGAVAPVASAGMDMLGGVMGTPMAGMLDSGMSAADMASSAVPDFASNLDFMGGLYDAGESALGSLGNMFDPASDFLSGLFDNVADFFS